MGPCFSGFGYIHMMPSQDGKSLYSFGIPRSVLILKVTNQTVKNAILAGVDINNVS